MQTGTPDSSDPKFRIKVAVTCLVLSAFVGALHGQMASESEARRADPTRAANRAAAVAAALASQPAQGYAGMGAQAAIRR